MEKRIDTGILGAKVGDKVIDRRKNKVGVVVDIDDSRATNDDVYCIDFGDGKPARKVNAMHDAQCVGRYSFVKEN